MARYSESDTTAIYDIAKMWNFSAFVPPAARRRRHGCALLASSQSCAITVSFRPAAKGARAAVLTVDDQAPDAPQTVLLRGAGE